MLIDFRQGLVQALSSPPFLVANGSTVNLVASVSAPVVITFAQGTDNYLFQETANITSAWTELPGSGTCYLYWDINQKTAVRTFGFTTLAPVAQTSAPSNPASGQMWYDTINFSQNVFSNGSWNPTLRVFAGTYTAGVVTLYTVGTQIGNVTQANAGYFLFDENNNPVKKFQAFNLGNFITTVSPLASQFSRIQNYNLESVVNTATTSANIAQFQAVCYTAADIIGIYTSNIVLPPYGSGTPCIGIAPRAMANGTVQAFVQQGYISNPAWNWGTVGANVFVSSSGFLTTSPPANGQGTALQVVGYVVDATTVYFSPQTPIVYG